MSKELIRKNSEAKKKWWTAIVSRQVLKLMKNKTTMILHDGYNIEDVIQDLENPKNVELAFDDILNITIEEKTWGSVLELEYAKNGKKEKFQYSIAQDWVKYPAKEPTKFMKVDWEPFVSFIKERQKITE